MPDKRAIWYWAVCEKWMLVLIHDVGQIYTVPDLPPRCSDCILAHMFLDPTEYPA